MAQNGSLPHEARIFAAYLVGHQPSPAVIRRYKTALSHNRSAMHTSDQRLLAFVHKHPWSLGIVDAGLAAKNPYSEVRRRLYVMLAILEATPEYTQAFLPQQRNPLYIFYIGYAGVRSVLKAAAGLVLIGIIT